MRMKGMEMGVYKKGIDIESQGVWKVWFNHLEMGFPFHTTKLLIQIPTHGIEVPITVNQTY